MPTEQYLLPYEWHIRLSQLNSIYCLVWLLFLRSLFTFLIFNTSSYINYSTRCIVKFYYWFTKLVFPVKYGAGSIIYNNIRINVKGPEIETELTFITLYHYFLSFFLHITDVLVSHIVLIFFLWLSNNSSTSIT